MEIKSEGEMDREEEQERGSQKARGNEPKELAPPPRGLNGVLHLASGATVVLF